jgi:hypothetical protein
MIARKILALPDLVQQALPGTSQRVDYPSGVLSFGSNRDTKGGGGIRKRWREPPGHTR